MEGIRILLFSPLKGNIGGISKWTHNTLMFFKDNNDLQIEQFYSEAKGAYQHTKIFNRVIIGLKNYIPLIFGFFKILLRSKFDIIHLSSSGGLGLIRDYLILVIARIFKVKTIVHFHYGRIPETLEVNNWERRILRCVINKCDLSIVLDQKSYNAILNITDNVVKLSNPINDSVIDFNINFKEKRKHNEILFVGHVVETKGIFDLVNACKGFKDLKLNILGAITPEARNKILELTEENTNLINILGEQNHETVLKFMRTSTIFVLPSYTEGFPNVIIEAMACSIPIIASNVGAIPEILTDGAKQCGIICSPKNEEELKLAIDKLINDAKFSDIISSNGYSKVINNYTSSIVYNQLQNIYKDLK